MLWAVVGDLRQGIHRLDKLGTVRTLLHPVNQLGGKTALPVHHHIRRFLHEPHRTGETAGRTDGVQVSETVSHQKYLVGILDEPLDAPPKKQNPFSVLTAAWSPPRPSAISSD